MSMSTEAVSPGRGWRRYFTWNTDHKVIGVQYLVTTFCFFLIGGLLAMLVRAELAQPGPDFLNGTEFNRFLTNHGSVMLFLWIIPVLAGFGNYLVPLMIGARDMAFPNMNALSFWLIPPAGLIMLASFFVGAAEAGWTAYAPLSIQTPVGQTLWAVSVIILGTSSLLGAVNFVTTVFTMRAEGMTFWRLPLFVWGMLATSLLVLLATPVLTAGLVLIAMDRMAGTLFFSASNGGDPILWQNMFWFYSHPAVYIMVLPAMGIVSEVYPVFSRKPIFGYKAIAMSSMAISILGLTVWAHHMFTSGMDPRLRIPYMISSMIIAVPTGIKIFSWLATIWDGKIRFTTPMLFALGFISMFLIGGITGIFLAAIPIDVHVHDTYFVVAHLHFVLFGGSVSAVYAGLYYWFPKITGRMYDERLGKVHFVANFVGTNLTYLPMFLAGLLGMPRRVSDYSPEFTTLNLLATLGAFLLGTSALPFIYNAVVSWVSGPKAAANPWRALTLEWQTDSPPPAENFHQPPVVNSGPYDYGQPMGVSGQAQAVPAVGD
ncbi:MAG: cytochrome c oxidase subunit I [Chloroflexi bacterium RBG_19FT_COMBO_62_14]|nr:MAG: cytochrome c oxidase subunit I [Chloroflexi bacterium RBG_19FT_COMBO_62_14]